MRDRDGDVLLLGAGHGSNSSLHLAEHRVRDDRADPRAAGRVERGAQLLEVVPVGDKAGRG